MSQRCRAQWIKVILICLQKQSKLKDFGVGDAKWGICGIIKLKGMMRLLKLLLAWRKAVNTFGKRGIDKNHRHTTGNFKTLSFEQSANMLEVGQFYQPRVWKLPATGALTRGASGRRVLAQRWRLGSSRTGNSWGQSSAQTELLYIFLGRQLGNWLYTC